MADFDPKAAWPGWETVKVLGRGSFGAVYEIRRDVLGDIEKAALKVITIPQSNTEIDELYGEGYDEESITAVFKEYLKSIVAEYSLMRKLNGCSNVVNCDDVRYIQHEDGFGWDIYIKMELLTPLNKALGREIPDEQVIRVGSDICEALILCRRHNIVHRDIKPANIFVSDNGDYKLGDFGIARTMEKTSGATKTGTYDYMAPEVYLARPYGSAVDIYSLGMVLYWLLNEKRTPFLPLPPALPTGGDKEQARIRRFNGEDIPAPAHGSPALQQAVLKAIAFDPKDRYQSAEEMLKDLERLAHNSELKRDQPAASPVGADVPGGPPTGKNPSVVRLAGDRRTTPPLSGEDKRADASEETVGADVPVDSRTAAPAFQDDEHTLGSIKAPTAHTPSNGEATINVHPAPQPGRAPAPPASRTTDAPKAPTAARAGTGPAADAAEASRGSSAPQRKKKWLPILIGAAAVVLILFFLLPKKGGGDVAYAPPETTQPAESSTPEPTPEPTPVPTPAPTPEPTLEPTSWVEGDWDWSVKNGVLTINGSGNMADYRSPDDVPWVEQREQITQVVIENGITGISAFTFWYCINVRSVTIPDSVTYIGDQAFDSCYSLTTVTIPSSVTSIGDSAFSSCTSLTAVTIPSSVTSIGDAAFSSCTSLTSIEVDSGNPRYCSIDGVLFTKDMQTLLCYPAGINRANYTLPDTVTSICNWAFCDCASLRSVTIQDGVRRINDGVFAHCTSLNTIAIPNSVTSIGAWAFFDCSNLSSITIMDSVTSIGYKAFDSCYSLTTVTIPSSVTSIGDAAFAYCTSLTRIDVDSDNPSYCSVDGVLFTKDGQTLICCPAGCSMSSYSIPTGVTSIDYTAFSRCSSLTSITIPTSVTSIGWGAFAYCTSLTSIEIPSSVTSIGGSAFLLCDSLTSVTILSSMASIGNLAFYGCSSLCDVYFSGTEEQWNAITFGEDYDPLLHATIHFGAG